MIKKTKKIIITVGIILSFFVMPFSSFAITTVLTGEATNITDTSVTLSGSANAGSDYAAGYFRYSMVTPGNVSPVFCNDIYGSNMESTNESKIIGTQTFKANIFNLFPNTKYYYCAIASNKNEINYTGGVNFFTTQVAVDSPNTPTASITTNTPLVVNSSSVYLNGFFNSNSASTTWFEYKKKLSISSTPLYMTASANPLVLNTSNILNSSGTITSNLALPTNLTSITTGTISNLGTLTLSNQPLTSQVATGNFSLFSTPGWKTVNIKNHTTATSGAMSFLLTGLSANTDYQFRAAIKDASGNVSFGNVLTFQTKSSNGVTPGNVPNGTGINSGTSSGTSTNTPATPLALGQTATPPADAIVRFQEGIETVLARQIVADPELAKIYGYQMGTDLQAFAWTLADVLARDFGYVNSSGKEIRVSTPDVAAYQLQIEGGRSTIYEYYNSKIVNIQRMTTAMRSNYYYEYYYNKR